MGFTFQVGDLAVLISLALLALGVRLLVLAWRNRSAPEFWIGLYLMLAPPATSLLMRVPRFDPAWHDVLRTAAVFGFAGSALSLAGFTWRTFRPQAAWAKVLFAVSVLYAAGLCGALLLGVTSPEVQSRSPAARSPLFLTYTWLFVECALQRRLGVRRLRIGLADPVVVNRFLLFEVWSGVLAFLPGVLLMAAALLTDHGGDSQSPFFAAVVRVTGLVIYATMWLSFLPPRAYTRWIRSRHPQRHPDAAVATAGG